MLNNILLGFFLTLNLVTGLQDGGPGFLYWMGCTGTGA